MVDEQRIARRARLVALGQAATVAVLVLGAAMIAIAAHAQGPANGIIGRTWPIAEPDALAEIEAKAARLPRDMTKAFGKRSDWSALKAASLAVAPADRVRTVVPFYTLEFDITLPGGKTLYPKGYTFNPLAFVRMPQRLVIVHPRDLDWALRIARASDFVLLTSQEKDGRTDSGDPIALSENAGRAIFILEDRVKARLGLTVAPVIVAQAGQKLLLTEYGPRIRSATAGGVR